MSPNCRAVHAELTDPLDDGMVVYPLLWAQGVGAGIMGLTAAKKAEIDAMWVINHATASLTVI